MKQTKFKRTTDGVVGKPTVQNKSETSQVNSAIQYGRDYEGYLAMLFILRAAINEYRFKVGVEIEQAHKFDDLLFLYKKGGKTLSKCLQAKHTTGKKKIDSMNLLTTEQSDFSIVKYYFSFKDLIREDFFRNITQEDLIVYTNFPLDVNSSIGPNMKMSKAWQPFESTVFNDKINKLHNLLEPIQGSSDILDVEKEESIRYRFNVESVKILKSKANEYNITRLAQALKEWLMGSKKLQQVKHVIKPYWKFLTEEVLDIANKRFRGNFIDKKCMTKEAKFFHQKMTEEIDRKNKHNIKKIDKYQSEKLTINSLSEGIGRLNDFPIWELGEVIEFDNVIMEEDIESFLKLFVFAVCQPNHSELKEIIKTDILEDQRGKYGNDDFYSEDDINRYVDEIFQHFHAAIFKWKDAEVDRKKKNNKDVTEIYMTDKNGKLFLENQWKEVKFDVKKTLISFTGRDKELEALHKSIQRGNTVKSQTKVICGLPGIGKTELIRSYIQEQSHRFENKIFWIDGKSSESIQNSFRKLAKTLKIPTMTSEGQLENIDKIVADVYREFQSKKCLFTFDDVSNQEVIEPFMPKETSANSLPFVIITSVNSKWDEGLVTELNVLSEQNAVKLIKSQVNVLESNEIKDIEHLAEILEFFPLAIQQVAAYIVKKIHNNSDFKIAHCIEEFSKNSKKILELELPKDISSYDKTTFANFKNILDSISKVEIIGVKSIEILNLMAYMSQNNIDMKWFSKYSMSELSQIFQLLKEYSIIRFESGMVNIHSLVQLVTRLELKQQEKEDIAFEEALQFFRNIFPEDDTMDDYVTFRQLIPHLEAFSLHLDEASKTWSKERSSKKLKEVLTKLDFCLDVVKDPHKRLLIIKRLNSIISKEYGTDTIEYEVVSMKWGRVEHDLGNFDVAKSHYLKTLNLYLSNYGEEHVKTSKIYQNLGIIELDKGNYNESKSYSEKALAILLINYGEHHKETFDIYDNLGNVELLLGNNDVAKYYHEKTLAAYLTVYDENHIKIANSHVNLGFGEYSSGNFDVSKTHYEKALAIFSRYYGEGHLSTAAVNMNLGNTELSLGNYDSSKMYYLKTLETCLKFYGEEHLQIADMHINLGCVESELCNFDVTKSHFEKGLSFYLTYYGENHIKSAKVYSNLGGVEFDLGNYNMSKSYLEKARSVYLAFYGKHHVNTAGVFVKLGNVELKLGNVDLSKTHLEEALAAYLTQYGDQHVITTDVYGNLGIVECQLGNFEMSKSFHEKQLAFRTTFYNEEHVKIADVHVNLGNTEIMLGDYETSKFHYDKALNIYLNFFGKNHVKTIGVAKNLRILSDLLSEIPIDFNNYSNV